MRRYRVFATIVAVALLVSGCTSSSSTTTPATSSAPVPSATAALRTPPSSSASVSAAMSSALVSTPPASVAQSSLKPTTSASKPATTSATVEISVPTTIASSAKSDTAFAVAAYRGSLAVFQVAFADPRKDWTQQIRTYEADPVAASDIASLKYYAAQSIHSSGHRSGDVTVSSVTTHKIVIAGCVDTSQVNVFDKLGKSIKAPNQPGSYWRVPQTVTLYKYPLKDAPKTGGWLVSEVQSNLQKTC